MGAQFYYNFIYKLNIITFLIPPIVAFVLFFAFYVRLFRKTPPRLRTNKLTKYGFNLYIENIYAYGADLGVRFSEANQTKEM